MMKTSNNQQPPVWLSQSQIFVLLLLIAVMPMTSTIALKNVLVATLLVLFLYALLLYKEVRIQAQLVAQQLPWVLWVWMAYLLIFPLIAPDSATAWRNLRGHWGQSILMWVALMGVFCLCKGRKLSLWSLGLASAFALGVHLLISFAAWGDWLPKDMYLGKLGTHGFQQVYGQVGIMRAPAWSIERFPWGFWGIENIHGSLGYTSSHATIFFAVALALAWRSSNWRWAGLRAAAIALCFCSIMLAQSRGAILFNVLFLLVLALMCLAYRITFKKVAATPNASVQAPPTNVTKLALRWGIAAIVLVLTLVGSVRYIQSDARWSSMLDKAVFGLVLPEPKLLICEGVTPQYKQLVQTRFGERGSAYVAAMLRSAEEGDSMRTYVKRVAFDLALAHPTGVDGSRYTYMQLMHAYCGHKPAVDLTHAHDGWLDTALAIGWVGIGLFAAMMLYFLVWAWRQTWRYWHEPSVWSWAAACFLLTLFWLLRGLADSVFREHFLQMQALAIGYTYLRVKQAIKNLDDTTASDKGT